MGALPPVTSSRRQRSSSATTLSIMLALARGASGPTSVAMSSGEPIFTASAFCLRRARNSSLTEALDDQPRAGDAALTGRGEDAGDLGIGGAFEVGVGEHDEGRLAAELERGAWRGSRPSCARLSRPSSGPPVKAMCATRDGGSARRRSVGPKPVMTLTTPLGKPASSTSRANSSSGAGPSSDALTTSVQPAASAGPSLTAARKSWLFHGTIAATTPIGSRRSPDLHVGLVDRQVRAFDLVGEAGVVAVVVGDVGDLRRRLADDLAGVARLELGEPAGVLRDQVAEPVQQLAARGRGHRRPAPPSQARSRPRLRRGRRRRSRASGMLAQARRSPDRCSRSRISVLEPPSI